MNAFILLYLSSKQTALFHNSFQLCSHSLRTGYKRLVVLLQILSLKKSLTPTILGIASVLQRSSLLFELDDLFPGHSVQPLVEFPHTEVDQLLVTDDC